MGSGTVVIVEDQGLQERLIGFLIGDDHRVVATAQSADEAYRAVAANRPDVVLMDLNLRQGNGLDATRRIKSAHPETAVIISSAYTDAGIRFEAFTAGAVGYLTKPYDRAHLIDAIGSALSE
ncbi:response regulator [Halobellus sp. GM3]|uniref:response regulator n=1 Tax=Halobellus sp. GM3 TaxID=3458410 RepID=UPI00403D86E2